MSTFKLVVKSAIESYQLGHRLSIFLAHCFVVEDLVHSIDCDAVLEAIIWVSTLCPRKLMGFAILAEIQFRCNNEFFLFFIFFDIFWMLITPKLGRRKVDLSLWLLSFTSVCWFSYRKWIVSLIYIVIIQIFDLKLLIQIFVVIADSIRIVGENLLSWKMLVPSSSASTMLWVINKFVSHSKRLRHVVIAFLVLFVWIVWVGPTSAHFFQKLWRYRYLIWIWINLRIFRR